MNNAALILSRPRIRFYISGSAAMTVERHGGTWSKADELARPMVWVRNDGTLTTKRVNDALIGIVCRVQPEAIGNRVGTVVVSFRQYPAAMSCGDSFAVPEVYALPNLEPEP